MPGGFAGVDIFFVISGFVVSASVAELGEISLREFLAYFYARRLFRIAPALIVCLLVTTLVFTLLIPASWLSGTNKQTGLAAFWGFSNFVLAGTDNDYFSPRVDFNPFTHTWSLAVEEQFYLAFPWLFIAFLWSRRNISVALFAGGFLASLAWAWHLGTADPDRAFYMLASRFWELASGVLLFQSLAFTKSRPLPARFAAGGAIAALAVVFAGLMTARPSSTPFPGGIMPDLGTLGVLACLYNGTGGHARRVLESRVARYIGKISYSLYLWHWPVLVLLRWTIGTETLPIDIFALALIFALSAASHAVIETPPRGILAMLPYPRIVAVGIGLTALGLAYGAAYGLWSAQKFVSLSTVMRHASDWYPDGADADPDFPTCKIQSTRLRLAGGTAWRYARLGCAAPATPPRQIFVIGDSHAAAYVAMMKGLVMQTGATVYVYGVGGCSFINLRENPSPQCRNFSTAAVADMRAKLRPRDVVFLPSLRIPRIVDEFASYGLPAARAEMASPTVTAARAAGIAAALPVLRQLAGAGADIIFEAPTPVMPAPAFRCADAYDRANPICAGGESIPRATIESLRAPVLTAYASFMDQTAAVRVWDPLPTLCPGTQCFEYDGAKPLYFDGDHLSGYANRMLLPVFLNFLNRKA